MGTCETPNPPRFAFSRLGPALQHLLWLVRGRNRGRQHGISSIFSACCLFDTLKGALTYRKIDAHWRCGPVPNDKALRFEERVACNFFPAMGSRPAPPTRRAGRGCRSTRL